MDTPDRKYGGYKLEEVYQVLAKSQRACKSLEKALGGDRGRAAVEMLRKGVLSDDIALEVEDCFSNEIFNEARDVWGSGMYDINDKDNEYKDFPICIREYEGVFFISALEYEDIGYFLSQETAENYARLNWDNIR